MIQISPDGIPPTTRAPSSRFTVVWLPVPGCRYEANNLGMLRHALSKRALTPAPDRHGYLVVDIRQNGRRRTLYVHRLVLLAFSGEPPTPRHQAAHADGCRQNNAIWNLRWATPWENSADRRRHAAVRKATMCARRRPGRLHLAGAAGRFSRVAR